MIDGPIDGMSTSQLLLLGAGVALGVWALWKLSKLDGKHPDIKTLDEDGLQALSAKATGAKSHNTLLSGPGDIQGR